ncbi:MAG: hypothetical protein ABIN58_11885 [candidate division WOR-3 bacterium]
MAIHAYDINGHIVGQAHDGSMDQAVAWETAGFTVIHNARHIDRLDFFKYADGELIELSETEKQAIIEAEETAQANLEARRKAAAETILNNLPSLQQVLNIVDGCGTLAELKVFLKKLVRVVYALAKNDVQ